MASAGVDAGEKMLGTDGTTPRSCTGCGKTAARGIRRNAGWKQKVERHPVSRLTAVRDSSFFVAHGLLPSLEQVA